MSTKIYDGCRLAEGVDLLEFTDKLRSVFLPIYDDVVTRWTVLFAAAVVKQAREKGEEPPRSPLWAGFREFETVERLNQFRLTEFEVAFARDPLTRRIHARPYMDAEHYSEAWYALPEVEPYPYWNNTDQPDDVSDDEWEKRFRAWDRVFGHDPVSERALIFTLVELHKDSALAGPRWPNNGLLGGEDAERRALVERYCTDEVHNLGVSVDDLLG